MSSILSQKSLLRVADQLATVADHVSRAMGRGLPAKSKVVADLERRIGRLRTLAIKDDVDEPIAAELTQGAVAIATELVRDLRLPEELLVDLRTNKWVVGHYGHNSQRSTVKNPLPTNNILSLRARGHTRKRKFPDRYQRQPAKLRPTPEQPMPTVWNSEVPDFPGRSGPGTYVAEVDLQALPTLSITECLHRLLFARTTSGETNWAGDKLLENGHLEWPAEYADPLVVKLKERLQHLPKVFGAKAAEAVPTGGWTVD